MNIMKGINTYAKDLSPEQIKKKVHRDFIGGMWDELGRLQFDFMIEAGLKPNHKLLDIGCGSLRGGLHYIRYLDRGNYFGLDINNSLIEAAKIELEEAGLAEKCPNLIVDDKFSFEKFNSKFDFMIAVSVFTHLPMNIIVRCLTKARENIALNGLCYATYFEAPVDAHIETIKHQPGGMKTNYDSDPFHYSINELTLMAKLAQLQASIVGDWNHPRNQKMAVFCLPK